MKEKRSEKIRKFIINNIEKHSNDIVALSSKKFCVSRTTIHRHLTTLIKKGEIIKSGTTNRIIYSLKNTKNKSFEFKILPSIEEDKIWSEYIKPDIQNLPKNLYEICYYGFTEMFNNALEHSEGKLIKVSTNWQEQNLVISIQDNGIGVFEKIKNNKNFTDTKEAAFHMAKGRLTTAPKNHTGEGIFFTSRVFDEFYIVANGLKYTRINKELNDFFIESSKEQTKGSNIQMKIGLKSKTLLKDIFAKFYTDPNTGAFDRTNIKVELSKLNEEYFISRSQAKRILMGLDKFKEIILDFKDVKSIGQGFADEVFRVFKLSHPNIEIKYTNANNNVEFMIKRSKTN